MGRHVIKQPNGKYAIWSTVVDHFIMCDITKEEYVDFRIKEEAERVREDLASIFKTVDEGGRYASFIHLWDEALEVLKAVHGEEELKDFLESCEEK